MSRNRAVSSLLVALSLWVPACSSYTQIPLDEVADHGKVRITTIDGKRETVHNPRVQADSIKGHVNEGVEQAAWTVAVDQVAIIEASGSNTVGTVLLVIGSLGVIFLVVAVASCNGFECG